MDTVADFELEVLGEVNKMEGMNFPTGGVVITKEFAEFAMASDTFGPETKKYMDYFLKNHRVRSFISCNPYVPMEKVFTEVNKALVA